MKNYDVLPMWQPWASLLVNKNSTTNTAYKVNETRSRPTQKRGTILIHACQKWNTELEKIYHSKPFWDAFLQLNGAVCLSKPDNLIPFGAIIGSVEIYDCAEIKKSEDGSYWIDSKMGIDYVGSPELEFGLYLEGRFVWRCTNPRVLLHPIPFKANQGWSKYSTEKELEFI